MRGDSALRFACLVIAFGLPALWAQTQPGTSIACVKDLPCNEDQTENVFAPENALLIPMDNGYYSNDALLRGAESSNGVFNPKVYGAIVRLLWADVPVAWLVRGGKTKTHNGGGSWNDPVDFRSSVAQVLPNAASSASYRDFRGGAFLVTTKHRARALEVLRKYNQDLSSGRLYLGPNLGSPFGPTPEYGGGTPVNVYNLAAQSAVPLYHLLTSKPYAAVFDSASFGKVYIQTKYMEDAGMIRDNWLDPSTGKARPYRGNNKTVCPECIEGAHYRVMSSADAANNLNEESCLSFVSEPHFHYAKEGNTLPVENFLRSMRNFLESGGNSLMECGGIYTYEQCDLYPEKGENPSQCIFPSQGGMFSTSGIVKGQGTKCEDVGRFDMPHSDLPISQFTGAWECIGGSVSRWKFTDGSGFQDSATQKSHSLLAGGGNFFVGGGKIDRTRETGGTFAYLAGHDYAKAPSKSGSPGARIYLNAVLLPAQRAPECGFTIVDGGDGVDDGDDGIFDGDGFIIGDDDDEGNAAQIAGGTLGTATGLASIGLCLAGLCCLAVVAVGLIGGLILISIGAAVGSTAVVGNTAFHWVGADINPLFVGQTISTSNPLYANA